MNCQDKIIYTIVQGDTLYKIAQKYKLTPEIILKLNPGLRPNNLKVGMNIIICSNIPALNSKGSIFSLHSEMRELWEEHVWWTRMLILNIVDNLNGIEETTKRLLQNPIDIARIYGRYYNQEIQDKIKNLIMDHLLIGDALIKAVNNNSPQVESLNKKWYENADEIADALSSINQFYDKNTLKTMLCHHLDLTKQEVMYRIKKQYNDDVNNYDILETEALMMSDYLSNGLFLYAKLNNIIY